MECKHNFKRGDEIVFKGSGSCDVCGSPQNVDGVIGTYVGDDRWGHDFIIHPRFACPGCGGIISHYHIPCGDDYVLPAIEVPDEVHTPS